MAHVPAHINVHIIYCFGYVFISCLTLCISFLKCSIFLFVSIAVNTNHIKQLKDFTGPKQITVIRLCWQAEHWAYIAKMQQQRQKNTEKYIQLLSSFTYTWLLTSVPGLVQSPLQTFGTMHICFSKLRQICEIRVVTTDLNTRLEYCILKGQADIFVQSFI